jgi:hypothetical protein
MGRFEEEPNTIQYTKIKCIIEMKENEKGS